MDPAARIEALLAAAGVAWERIAHAHAHSSEEAAAVRGTPLAIGGKSLLFKLGPERFAILAVSGARRIDNRRLRHALGVQRYRFATAAELAAITGLAPGCVPPFGRPVFDVALYVDAATASQVEIAFSLASHTVSARMATADWLAVARPDGIFDLTR